MGCHAAACSAAFLSAHPRLLLLWAWIAPGKFYYISRKLAKVAWVFPFPVRWFQTTHSLSMFWRQLRTEYKRAPVADKGRHPLDSVQQLRDPLQLEVPARGARARRQVVHGRPNQRGSAEVHPGEDRRNLWCGAPPLVSSVLPLSRGCSSCPLAYTLPVL